MDSRTTAHGNRKQDIMANDEQWVEDVKRWYCAGGATAASETGDGDEEVAIGYEAAQPALQARHWPDAPLTRDR